MSNYMKQFIEHDRKEIEKLKEWARFARGEKMPVEYLNKLDENYARILTIASIHSSFMEVERKGYE